MSKFYYDQPIKYSWHKTIPVLALLLACSLIYLSAIVAGKFHASFTPQPILPYKAIKSASATLSIGSDLTETNLFDETNIIRTQSGIQPLKRNNLLANSAQKKCQDIVKNNYWSHIDRSGKHPWQYIVASGYDAKYAGENLAYGFESTALLIKGWLNSAEHKKALLNKNYSDAGFAICTSTDFIGTGKQTIVVQHLGKTQP